jgi:hypothetical protein
MQREDFQRQAKVVDMMLTMHSILGSRFSRRAKILELFLLTFSIILVASTFLDPKLLLYINIKTEIARLIIGACSIFIFLLSMVFLVVDWKGQATQHRWAFNVLIPFKAEWREVLSLFDEMDERYLSEFSQKSMLIVGNLIPIPDSQFNSLKARHYHKVMLSKLISYHPGSSIILLKICLWLRSNRRVLNTKLPE